MTFIYPNNPYLATTADGQNYLEMNQRNLQDCRRGVVLLCKPYQAIEKSPEPGCNIALFKQDKSMQEQYCSHRFTKPRSTFIRAEETNRWAYSVPKPTKAITKCANKPDDEKVMILQATGFLSIEPGCLLVTDSKTLLPHSINATHIQTSQDKFAIPSLYQAFKEGGYTSSLPKYQWSNKSDYQELLKHISTDEFIKSDTKMEEINQLSKHLQVVELQGFHNTWLRSLSSVIAVIVVGTLLYIAWKRIMKWYQVRKQKRSVTLPVVHYHNHEEGHPIQIEMEPTTSTEETTPAPE